MGGYGKHGTQAIQLAMDEINGKGGILGRKVEAIFADDELKVDKGVQITKKFINEDKVDFIIGPTSSGVALAMADIVEQQKKILVLTQAATEMDLQRGATSMGGVNPNAHRDSPAEGR